MRTRIGSGTERLCESDRLAVVGQGRCSTIRRDDPVAGKHQTSDIRIPIREFERFHDAVMGAMTSDVSADLVADPYGH